MIVEIGLSLLRMGIHLHVVLQHYVPKLWVVMVDDNIEADVITIIPLSYYPPYPICLPTFQVVQIDVVPGNPCDSDE